MKNDNIIDLQSKLESKLREDLLSNSSEDNFKNAYNELHIFFLEKAQKEEIYSRDLKWFSKIFLRKIGIGNKVLDIGTGNGKLALALAQNNNEVTAIDISSVAIDIANNKLQEIDKENLLSISFLCGDARNLDFPDQSFDFITSQDLIEHLSEMDFLIHLNEIERVLKIGGKYLFWTPSKLRGASSLGLHLKEYTIREINSILKNRNFKYNWIDLRFFKLKLIVELPQYFLPLVVLYEKFLELFIKFFPNSIRRIIVPPLFFSITKIKP